MTALAQESATTAERLTPGSLPADPAPVQMRFSFLGDGREYFGIWLTNLALSIMTLGIYSAWAKVRRTEYVYRNIVVADAGNSGIGPAGFQYLANPWAVLRGRVVAALLVAAYATYGYFPPWAAMLMLLGLTVVGPWLAWMGIRFRHARSRHRGQCFVFDGTLLGAYEAILPAVAVFLGPAFFLLALAGSQREQWIFAHAFETFAISTLPWLLFPWAYARYRRWLTNHTRWGGLRFSNDVPARAYYAVFAKAVVLAVVAGVLGTVVIRIGIAAATAPKLSSSEFPSGLVFFTIFFGFALGWNSVWPYCIARLQKTNWEGTRLGGQPFICELKARDLIMLYFRNFFLLLATLGLWRPFGWMQVVKVRVESLQWQGDPQMLAAEAATARVSPVGSETADFLGVDLGL